MLKECDEEQGTLKGQVCLLEAEAAMTMVWASTCFGIRRKQTTGTNDSTMLRQTLITAVVFRAA